MDEGIRTLLVHLDGDERDAARLQLARRLALEHGAAVTALFATAPMLSIIPMDGDASGAVAQMVVELEEQRHAHARKAFESVLGEAAGVAATYRELPYELVAPAFAREAMYADLTVVGQRDPAAGGTSGVPGDFPERVMAGSGRPVLVVPYTGKLPERFATIAIAWKETPECARAVAGALPLLRKAGKVHVLAWEGRQARPDDTGRLDLRHYLESHGVESAWHDGGPEPGGEVGDLLLSACADVSADLLVMGCYGHSRAREWMLGGASRTVLHTMTLPVLMAH